jgi:hypothetical protein
MIVSDFVEFEGVGVGAGIIFIAEPQPHPCSSNQEPMMKIIVLHMTLKCFLIDVMFSCH